MLDSQATKARRRSAAYVFPKYETDGLGRGVVLPAVAELASAPVVRIRMENGKKLYEPESREDQFSHAAAALEEFSR